MAEDQLRDLALLEGKRVGSFGCYAFPVEGVYPVTKFAENGVDEVIDWPATLAQINAA